MSDQSTKLIIRRFYDEVVNRGNLEAADRLLAPGFIEHGDPPKDREEFKQFLTSLASAFPDIHLEVHDLIAEGNTAAARVSVSGTQLGQFAGYPATGKHAIWNGVDIFRLVGDQIAERWNFRDLLSLFSQLAFLEPSMTPYICVKGAHEAIEFYKTAFGAREVERLQEESGRVSHAELRIGNARIYLADEHPEIDFISPSTLGGSAVLLDITVPDADAVFNQAIDAGAKVSRPMADQGGGLRNGKLVDPYGHTWMISTFTSG